MALPIRNSRIKLSQGHLFWREIGQGVAVVFLHGSWSDGSQWLPLMEHLSRHHHCFAPDLLGFGDSERPNIHYSIALEIECLAEYLEALKQRRIYLVGHSLGGWIAANYALKYPEQVQGLILIAPEGAHLEKARDRWGLARWLVGRPPILPWLLNAFRPIARLLGATDRLDRVFQFRQQLRQSPTACKLLFKRRRAEIKAELLQAPGINASETPVLILQGDDAETEPLSKAYAQLIPTSEIQFLPGHSTDLPETQPDTVAEQIRSFIQKRR